MKRIKIFCYQVVYFFDKLIWLFFAVPFATLVVIWRTSGDKANKKYQDYTELDKGLVRCKECEQYFNPFNQVGLCPHGDFNNWIGLEPENQPEAVIMRNNTVSGASGDVAGGDLIKIFENEQKKEGRIKRWNK